MSIDLNRLTFPFNIAAGVEARGFEPGRPKTVVSPGTRRIYREVVAALRRHFAAWGLAPAEARPKRR